MKKIDAHLHLAQVVAGYCRRGESRAIGNGYAAWANGEEFPLFPEGYGDTHFYAERALEIMQDNDVEKAVLMQGSLYGFQNRYYYEVMQKYPGRFCASCTVDPFMTDHMAVLERFLKEQKFHLVKFEISSGGGLMGCHEPFDISGRRMMEIYRLIERHKGVLALDIGDIMMPSHQPMSIVRISEACPELKITVCHLLAPVREKRKEWELSLRLLDRANIRFDISSMPKIMDPDCYPYPETKEYLTEAKEILGAKKLMWGTDAPFAATKDSYEHLADYLLKDSAFSEDELQDVYYNNAADQYFS